MNHALNETIEPGYERPRDPVEIWLARKWQYILGFAVGIRENFFGIGGNSLDAARVIDAILVEFDVQLPLNVLTEHPTVERTTGRPTCTACSPTRWVRSTPCTASRRPGSTPTRNPEPR